MLFNEKTTETIKMCRCCFMCRHACPTFLATKLDSHTPRGYAINLARINEGMANWDETGFERLFHCSQCGLCKELCEFSWPEDEMVLEGRREMIKAGKTPQAIKKMFEDVTGNRQIKNDIFDKSIYDQKNCDVLYIAGTALMNNQTDIIKSMCQIFEDTKTNYTMQKIEDISGVVLSEMGFSHEAEVWAENFEKQIKLLSPKQIVVSCAHTYDFIKKNMSEISVIHAIAFIGEKFSNKTIHVKKGNNERVMYHDPCRVGRANGIYDIPRTVIEACSGNAVVEFFHNKAEAECCGAGACVDMAYPKIAAGVAKKRMEQAAEQNIKTVITACPNCKKVFEAVVSNENFDINIMDVAQYVQKNM
jgi:heterodisulfide reductase subunit D